MAEVDHNGKGAKYNELLAAFGAEAKSSQDSVRYLESLGFRKGQARSAVYQYRKQKGLVATRDEQQQGS